MKVTILNTFHTKNYSFKTGKLTINYTLLIDYKVKYLTGAKIKGAINIPVKHNPKKLHLDEIENIAKGMVIYHLNNQA